MTKIHLIWKPYLFLFKIHFKSEIFTFTHTHKYTRKAKRFSLTNIHIIQYRQKKKKKKIQNSEKFKSNPDRKATMV